MKTMTEIAAALAANLAPSMADIQQRMAQLDPVLDELRAAGVTLEIRISACRLNSYTDLKPDASVGLTTHNSPAASIVRSICEKHGGGWYCPEETALSTMHGINVHIFGLDLTDQEGNP